MGSFLARKALQFSIALFGMTLLSFGIIQLAPGDPTGLETSMNPRVSVEARERMRRLYGLDRPLHVQYIHWLRRCVTLDMGNSFSDGEPVTQKILRHLPITIAINLLSLLLILVVAIPIGILSAIRPYSWFDKATTLFVFAGFSLPSFWFALLLMIFFGVYLGIFPLSGHQSLVVEGFSWSERLLDYAHHLTLPVFVSSIAGFSGYSRYLRSEMLEVIRQDYIRTARAKGLSERRVICHHALRNALLPIVTLLGMEIPSLIGGSVIVENIFAIPGMGRLSFQAVFERDYPVIMGLTLFVGLLTLMGNFLADVVYSWLNPKIRLS